MIASRQRGKGEIVLDPAPKAALRRWTRAMTAALLVLLVGRVASSVWLYTAGFEGLSGDAHLRTLLAADWAARPYLAAGGVWLPGHMIALGVLLAGWGDLVVVPRLFSVALGLAAIALVAALGASLFRDARAGLAAALLLACDPAHLWVAATPLNENLHLALTLLALLAVGRFEAKGRPVWVALAGGVLLLANAVRFEAWLVSVAFAGVVLWWVAHRRLAPAALAAAALPFLVPAAFIAANWWTFGDLLFWPNAFRAYNLRAYGPGADPAGVLEALWTAEGPLLLLAIAACGWAVSQAGAVRRYLLLTGVPAIVVIVALAASREPVNNLLRYLVPFLALLAPLIGGFAVAAWERSPSRGRRLALAGVAATLLAARLLVAGAPPPEPSNAGLAVGREIAAHRASEGLPAGPIIADASSLAVYAMMVGASDARTILLDRPVDPAVRRPPILSLEAAEVLACAGEVGAVGLVTPSRDAERLPGASLVAVVNGFRIVRVNATEGDCPGETARWPDFARDATGRLFAALAYRMEG